MVIHLESDILECEVKWALGSITINKASGGDKIPTELFITLKDDGVKGCTQYVHKFENLGSGHGTRKGQFSFQSQRMAMPRNLIYCTVALISYASEVMLRFLQARLQQYVNCELPDVQAGFIKGRRTRYQTTNICWIIEKARVFQKKILKNFEHELANM